MQTLHHAVKLPKRNPRSNSDPDPGFTADLYRLGLGLGLGLGLCPDPGYTPDLHVSWTTQHTI